jgi:hypothetical protein
MRFRPAVAILLFTAVPAFAQPFTLEFTGGTVDFGAAPLHIAVLSPNGGGTSGNVVPAVPPASLSCTPTEAVTLAGSHLFAILGTTKQFGHSWDVQFVFPGPPFGNQGNLSASELGVDRQIRNDDPGHGHGQALLEDRRHVGGVPVCRAATERVAS